jgi:Trk K+ transport system NAD-binding subunit/nucleotide-binding universal stress UspA family protein
MSQNYCRLTGGDNQQLLIIGGGDVGVELARRLADGWQVTMMDLDTGPAQTALAKHGVFDTVSFVEGDATSRLQLERAGAANADAIVITTRPDEVGLETARILRGDFGADRLLVLLRQAEMAPRFDELSIPYVHDYEAVAGSLVGRITRGSRIAGDIGLGSGELLETEIMPNSSVIGKPLALLSPQRWLVAAIYRKNALVVPHGNTQLEAGDRVLLVGDPTILPCIARFLSTGHSEFPLPYGSNLGILAPPDPAPLIPEVEYLLQSTRAESVEFISPLEGLLDMDRTRGLFVNQGTIMRQVPTKGLATGPIVEHLQSRDIGLLVAPPPEDRWMDRTGLSHSAFLRRLDGYPVPTLVARNTFPYKSIMLVIADPAFNMGAAIMAIDVARMLHAGLTVTVAVPPDFVSGTRFAQALDTTVSDVVDLAHSYRVTLEVVKLMGNPVQKILATSGRFHLAVCGYSGKTRHNLLRPSVEQALVHRAQCSVLVLPA